MKLITQNLMKITGLFVSVLLAFTGFSQGSNTVTFNYTGSVQSWTVPNCVTSIDVTVAGGQGGMGGTSQGSQVPGGAGTVVTATIPVTPGQVIDLTVGGEGNWPSGTGGWPGGGNGWPGSSTYGPSGGGGGYSGIEIGGTWYLIAAGGGGSSGGDNYAVTGGGGGCLVGQNGPGSIFTGSGGGGGTQTAGGAGGPPWGGGQWGTAGGYLQGGTGGYYPYASGGGGGGGYYGGGGGGGDNCCPGANGGGAGGGGSSLLPAGAGCTAASNTNGDGYITITYIGGLNAVASNTGPYCSGDDIQLSSGGGATYNWTGPNGYTSTQQNPVITASTTADAGTYQVIVTDPNCPGADTATTTVVVNPTPTANPIADQTVCNGSSTTAVTFSSSTPGTSYNWTNNNTNIGLGASGTGNIPAFTGTAPTTTEVGTITVTPSTATCTGPDITFTITVEPDPTITVSNDTTVCENGTVTLVANATGGGGGPYTYYWDFTGSTAPTQIVNPVAPGGTYSVYAESGNGCISATESINVTMYPPLTGTITPDDTICPGYPTDITATVSGGIGTPYNFVWSSGETQNGNNTSMTISANPPSTQNYFVTITDQCESTPLVMSTNIRVAPLPVPSYEVLDPEQCEPAVFTVVNTTPDSLSQYVYWAVDEDYIYINQDTIVTPAFMEGTYNIQMIVTTYEGCVDSLTFVDALEVKPRPTASFTHSPNPVQMFNTEVFFANTSYLGYTYEWWFEEGIPSSSTQENVHVQFPDGETGSYEVILVTTSELGCTDTMIYQLVVFPEVLIYAPNSFTPDGDEHNQDWRIFMEGIDVFDFELLIFNRWGEIVWESHDIEIPWDGTYNGKFVESGTYTWVVRTKDILNDGKYTYTGSVTIFK